MTGLEKPKLIKTEVKETRKENEKGLIRNSSHNLIKCMSHLFSPPGSAAFSFEGALTLWTRLDPKPVMENLEWD